MGYGKPYYFRVKGGEMIEIDSKEYEESVKERKIWEIYNAFRDYSGVDISYNRFLPILEELTKRADSKESQGEENE